MKRKRAGTKQLLPLIDPFAPPESDPQLPDVLLIGDSISIGYTIPVRILLDGVANVHRPPENCGPTRPEPEQDVLRWTAGRTWDVIHFNFGIWDTHNMRNGEIVPYTDLHAYPPQEITIRHTPEQYVANLAKTVDLLEPAARKLIWARTTPVMRRETGQPQRISRNNRAADRLMKERGILVNDLFNHARPHVGTWQQEDLCHFNALGYAELGIKVADCVSAALTTKYAPISERRPRKKRAGGENE